MNIDGQNTLACLCRIDRNTGKDAKIYPLPHSELPYAWNNSRDYSLERARVPLVYIVKDLVRECWECSLVIRGGLTWCTYMQRT